LNVLELGARTLLEIDRRLVEPLIVALKKYHFAESIEIHDRSTELHQIALHGPGLASLLQQACDSPAELPNQQTHSTSAMILGHDVIIWRDDPCGVPGLHLIVASAHVRAIWMHLITRFSTGEEIGKRLLRPIGWAAFNVARIEAGRPLFGIDFDESLLPHETGPLLNRAVSFTKGCYPGQEIVARMHARGGVARQIVGIRMNDDALPIAGTKIYDSNQNEIGGVTSSTISPILSNASIAIGIVKRPHFAIGTTLVIPAEGQMRQGKVVPLPFVGATAAT
jgi:folate-binding protein YgfZ